VFASQRYETMKRAIVIMGWTLVFWFGALFLMGFVAGLVDGSPVNPGAESAAQLLGRKHGAVLLLGSLGISVLASVFGVLPGAGKRRAPAATQ
jgi:hypothetical protein